MVRPLDAAPRRDVVRRACTAHASASEPCANRGPLLLQALHAPRSPSGSGPPRGASGFTVGRVPLYPPVRRLLSRGRVRQSRFRMSRPPRQPRACSWRPPRPYMGRFPAQGRADRTPQRPLNGAGEPPPEPTTTERHHASSSDPDP
jgi:hypothetical protein